MRHLRKLLLGLVALVVLVVGGTWAYINLIRDDAPDRLTLSERPADEGGAGEEGAGDGGDLSGTWTAAAGSEAGYRVDEVLFGQNATAAGRTQEVSGELVIEGTTVGSTEVTVDMTTITSDERRRDGQFHGRIMDTARFPTATFTLTEPIQLPEGDSVTVSATGELTLRGTTKPVTIDLQAQRLGDDIEVLGSTTITFDEWGIPNPSFAGITTEDHGELEFRVVFTRA